MNRTRIVAGFTVILAIAACGRDTHAPTAPAELAQKVSVAPASDNAPVVTNAVYTILNNDVDVPDGVDHCSNGLPDPQNCNIYGAKKYVWLGGEAIRGNNPNALSNGMYFFAVLEPGGQQSPNDDSPKVLSDLNPSTNTGAGDTYQNRIFTINDGVIAYTGHAGETAHDFANNKIRLFPYDDTPNNGGEYIMAVCSLADGYPVDPSRCKYDAFKVKVNTVVAPCDESGTCPPPPCTGACGPTPALALTASKTAAGTNDRTFKWSIGKAADETLVKSATGSATFKYTVTATRDAGTPSNILVTGGITLVNPNAAAVAITGVTDVLSNGTACAVNDVPATLAPGNTALTYSCDLGSLPAEAITNTATVSWAAQAVDGHPLAEGSATTPVTAIAFTETVIDGSVNVTDTFGDLGSTSATRVFTYEKTFEGNAVGTCTTHDNTATFTTNDAHATGSASQAVKVCVGADLTASKTATPTYTRTYAWGIAKAVDKTVVKQVGGSATFTYTVNAAQTGTTDSNWLVSGAITVNNPNDWEAVTVNLSDAIDNGGTCTVVGGSNVSVPASGSVTANYTCAYTSTPVAAYTNTATASWDKDAAGTPNAAATGTASGAFGLPTMVFNGSVTVHDAFNGSAATTLGTLTASDATPATGSWTYTHVIAVVANSCLTYNNTAAYLSNTGASNSANQSVMVCGNVAGGLTIGFWQNKNGQAIITGGTSTSGVCNSATALRTYAPFQDMSATATCAQVASYAMTIIKSASAAGVAMNAMLKAQMLATALNVYFSTPSLGGNRINSPVALGGVKVDLTMVCSTISLCSSTYANVSAAFGGATSLTVNEILAYATGRSNAGGSAWYDQVKATQEAAKNTFDAINNAVALVSP